MSEKTTTTNADNTIYHMSDTESTELNILVQAILWRTKAVLDTPGKKLQFVTYV